MGAKIKITFLLLSMSVVLLKMQVFASVPPNQIEKSNDQFKSEGSTDDLDYELAEKIATDNANDKCRPNRAKQVSQFQYYRLPGGLAGNGVWAYFTCEMKY